MDKFNWSAEAEKQWDERADSWNAKSNEMWDTGSRKDIVPFVKAYLPLGARIVDFGCGDGYGTIQMAMAGFRVKGVDVSQEMVSKANLLAGENTEMFVKADISSVPFEQGTFDAAIAINSLEWTEDPLAVLLEMARVVKNSGHLCIGLLGPTAMPRTHSYRRLYGEKVICNTMMPWELEKLAQENGFKKVAEFGVYKRGGSFKSIEEFPVDLKQAVSFMWVFLFERLY